MPWFREGTRPAITSAELLQFRDTETGSIWNLKGEAVDGPLQGGRLLQVPAYSAYWFAWASFWPHTSVWGEPGSGAAPAPDLFDPVDEFEILADAPLNAIPILEDPVGEFGRAEFVTPAEADYLSAGDLVLGSKSTVTYGPTPSRC